MDRHVPFQFDLVDELDRTTTDRGARPMSKDAAIKRGALIMADFDTSDAPSTVEQHEQRLRDGLSKNARRQAGRRLGAPAVPTAFSSVTGPTEVRHHITSADPTTTGFPENTGETTTSPDRLDALIDDGLRTMDRHRALRAVVAAEQFMGYPNNETTV